MNMPSTSKLPKHSKYDYTIFLNSAKKESEYECFTSFISEKIAKCREEHYDNNVHLFNRAVLAKMIGMETSTLTRIINGGQPTRKRDIIIALCFALQLTTSEADLALKLYPMAPLNPNNMRDLVIIHALNDGVAVKEVNDILNFHGFSELNILRSNKKFDDSSFYYPASSSSFEEVSVEVTPYCIAGDHVLLSLNFKYDPEIYYYGVSRKVDT